MPELPDVQVDKEYLDATALHQRVRTVHVDADRTLAVSPGTLRRHLKGRALAGTRRHGKWLFAAIEGDDRWLLLHFGMTGFLKYWKDGDGAPEHARLILDLAGGAHLAYDNQRRFGRIDLIADPGAFIDDEGLGPDPLADDDFDLRAFRARLHGRRGGIKSALMNQGVLAGLGNVYSDEILFQAGIDPRSPVAALSGDDVAAIYRALRHVVDRAITARARPGDMPRSWLTPRRGGDGARCPRDGATLAHAKVAGRTAWYCPRHQRRRH